MRRQKKFLALFLALACLMSAVPMAAAAEGGSYSDVPASHWAYDVIEKWADRDVLPGVDGDLFEPDRPLTLDDMAYLLKSAYDYTCDVSGSDTVSREQAIMYFAEALNVSPVDADTTFEDDANISAEYKPYVNAFQRLGYVNGTDLNTFEPQRPYTRAEALTVLDNVARPGIRGVATRGEMYNGGVRLTHIILEYNVPLTGAEVSPEDYEINVNVSDFNANSLNYGDGQPGDILDAYIQGENHVVLSVYTDYFYSSEQGMSSALRAGVKQVNPITAGDVTIAPSKKEISNFYESASTGGQGGGPGGPGGGGQGGGPGGPGGGGQGGGPRVSYTLLPGTYFVTNVEGFKYFTDKDSSMYADLTAEDLAPAFVAPEPCFDEKTGDYVDGVTVDYALWLPEDYSEDGNYAMVIVDHPASEVHPYEMVRTSRGPSYFITDEAQQIVKDEHGLDGLIVVVPVVAARVNDDGGTPAGYAALVQLWDYLIDTYPVDKDHVYGVGQSVGGMILAETNTVRDNYFAGILMYDNQWGSNYYEDIVYERGMAGSESTEAAAVRGYPSTDPNIIWNYYLDEDGNQVTEGADPNNYYWMISDDNIMIMNSWTGNWISRNTWTEARLLYHDLVGYDMAFHMIEDFTAPIEEQDAEVAAWLEEGSSYNGTDMGLYWLTFNGGGNMITPLWSRRLTAPYEWLLKQDRQDEIKRPKLDLNKPFAEADEQIQTEERLVNNFVIKNSPDDEGSQYYFVTGKAGAGTKYYNTGLYNMGNNAVADFAPGWLPDGMTARPTESTVIKGVTAIDNGGKLAVAVEYSSDMENLVIHLKGEPVIGYWGDAREDDLVKIAPFDFYDAGGALIACEITNAYVNSSAAVRADAEQESGSGSFVILETDADWTDAVSIIQRTTLRTDDVIASASPALIPAG